MPFSQRFRFHPASRAILATAAGLVVGGLIGWGKSEWHGAEVALQLCTLGGSATLALLRGLAVPLLVVTLILGNVGLEPMRRLPTIVGKTLAWMLAASLLACTVGWGSSWLVGPAPVDSGWPSRPDFVFGPGVWRDWPNGSGGWLALALLGLAFGYYRNQIQEGPAKTLTRLCQAIQEAASLLLQKVDRWLAVGIFLLVTAETAQLAAFPGRSVFQTDAGVILRPLAAAGLIYVLAWTLLTWLVARVPMWKVLPALLPALCLGLSACPPQATFPLTLAALRRVGVSDRVAGVSLSLGAVLQRDGVVLGLSVLAYAWRHPTGYGSAWIFVALAMCLQGGLDALAGRTELTAVFFLSLAGNPYHNGTLEAVLVASVGGGVSVFSQACIAAIIARGEGEYWVPGAPPDPDELQGLKNDLATADS